MSKLQRLRGLVSGKKVPLWLVVIFQIFQQIPSQKSNFEFWFDAARSMGGMMELLATIIQNPFFNGALVIASLCWITFVGEPRQGVQAHPWLRVIGPGIIYICFTAIAVTACIGAIQIYIRQSVAEIQANYLRDGANPAMPASAIDLERFSIRHLSRDQMKFFIQQIAEMRSEMIPIINITYSDAEALSYSSEFAECFRRAGIKSTLTPQAPNGPEQTGVMIDVLDVHNIGLSAEKIRHALINIGIVPKIVQMPDDLFGNPKAKPQHDWVLFVGPKPL